MGRQRNQKGRAEWPAGFKARAKAGTDYYSYRDPVSGREIGLGTDLQAALRAVRLVQRRSAPDAVRELVARIEQPSATVTDHAEWFLSVHLPARRRRNGDPLARGTLENYRLMIGKAVAAWARVPVPDVDRAMVVAELDRLPAESANRLRSVLQQFFAHATARGLRDDNPVDGTVKRDVVRVRERLGKSDYDAIHDAAPAWIQRAMTLSLLSLQRPSDLCCVRRDAWADGWWSIEQSKGRGHGVGRFRFKPHRELAGAIAQCMNHPVEDCPFLLARVPERRIRARGREHWAQISDEILSRAFAKIRDGLGLKFSGVAPSYYEIKALGGRLYEEQGRSKKWIQSLMGHREESTTQIYLDGHREKWVDVVL